MSNDNKRYLIQNEILPRALIIDLDGTLALLNGRNPFSGQSCDKDLHHTPVINICKNYLKLGYKILIVSGRSDKFKDISEVLI